MSTPFWMGSPIIVVDDDPDIRVALTSVLESAGYRTVPACNGIEALSVAAREKPGLVLLDLMMPQMDGWQFLAERRKDAGIRRVPVVVISAHLREAEGMPEDVSGYLPK